MNWISVNERLPYVSEREPMGVTVLVFIENKYWDVADYTHGGLWISHSHRPITEIKGVTHWCEVTGPEEQS